MVARMIGRGSLREALRIALVATVVGAAVAAAARAGDEPFALSHPAFNWVDKERVVTECHDRLLSITQESPSPQLADALARLCLSPKMAPEQRARQDLESLFEGDLGETSLHAAAALAPLGDKDALKALEDHVRSLEAPTLAAKLDVLRLLGMSQSKIVTEALASEDHATVIQALNLLQACGKGKEEAALIQPFLQSADAQTRLAAASAAYALTADKAAFELLSDAALKGTGEDRLKAAEAFALAAERSQPYLYNVRQQSAMIRLADELLKGGEPQGWAAASRLHAALGIIAHLPEVAQKVNAAPPAEQAQIIASIIQTARLYGTSKADLPCGHVVDIYAPDALEVIQIAMEEAQDEGLGRIEIEHLIIALCKWRGQGNVFALLGKDARAMEQKATEALKRSGAEGQFTKPPDDQIPQGMFFETERFKKWRLAVYAGRQGEQKPDLCDLLDQLVKFEQGEGGGILTDAGIKAADVDALRQRLRPAQKGEPGHDPGS